MHPSVVLAIAAIASCVWTVVGVRRCRRSLAAGAPASETWDAVSAVAASALLLLIMAIALLAPLIAPIREAVAAVLLLGVVAWIGARVAAACAERRERRVEELAMRERGLPVREPTLSWQTVGVLAFVCGLVAAVMWLTAVTLVMELVRGHPYTPGDTVMAVVTGVWLGGASIAMLCQWLRIRRIDRGYWPSFRAALRHAEPRS